MRRPSAAVVVEPHTVHAAVVRGAIFRRQPAVVEELDVLVCVGCRGAVAAVQGGKKFEAV